VETTEICTQKLKTYNTELALVQQLDNGKQLQLREARALLGVEVVLEAPCGDFIAKILLV